MVSLGSQAQPQLKALLGSNPAVVVTDQVRAELLVHAPQGLAPGLPAWVGLRLSHQPHWHTYWRNPGDSGLPTELNWTLPPNLQVGPLNWPVPQRLSVGKLINHGYEGTVLLTAPLTVKTIPTHDVTLQLQASWLVCRQECIPQEGQFSLTVPAQGTAAHAAEFELTRLAQPRTLDGQAVTHIHDNALSLRLDQLPAEWVGRELWAVPEQSEITQAYSPTNAEMKGRWQGNTWHITLPLSEVRSTAPAALSWLISPLQSKTPEGVLVNTTVQGTWPALRGPAVSPALQAALDANLTAAQDVTPMSYLLALLGALLGGLILNLMPCVFPVLAIKVLGFAQHAQDRRAHRLSGLAYTAGVVVSFLSLGLMLLLLRAAGDNLGWGFQLQNPWVVSGLAALFTLLALNLAGLFEFGNLLPSGLASFQAKHPVVDAFFSGVLAVLVASPCTAPFMGASLGLAVTLPDAQALLIFAAMGLGLALPYLLASWVPAFARALPRPGAWMALLRQTLAFPMLLTVVWLVWVLGQQAGMNAAAVLLVALVLLSAVLWAWRAGGRVQTLLAPVLVAVLSLWLWQTGHFLSQAPAQTEAVSNTSASEWQSWSPERVAQARTEGRTVFVDFTAAWCVTCQLNKQTTLANPEVLAAFQARNVLLLRADWTRRDARITQALAELGRSGVPVYAVYQGPKPPKVLSELISVREVITALEKP
jgi:thiol:disulfide interchange protein DsbD